MNFTSEQRAAFERDGYIIVSGLFDAAHIDAARQEIEETTYGKSFQEYLKDHEQGKAEKLNEYALDVAGAPKDNIARRSQFPTGIKALDSLIENDKYLDCFAACLGTDQMSYLNAHLFVRSGTDDARHAPMPWQGYHIDDNTCSFLPPHPAVASFEYINSWVMTHDIDEDGAPLHVIPGSHRQIADILPRLAREGDGIHGGFQDIRKVSEFESPVPVIAKAGDALLYSSYLVHGAVAFKNKKKQRAVWTMSIGRAENDSWTRFSHLYQRAEREFAIPFWIEASPRVRSLFGWPQPGHAYYTPETLELLAAWFPGMNLEPYRSA